MWINPNHPNPPRPPQPPPDLGQRLATFPRGRNLEMRVSLAHYQGRAYVALRVWERDSSGAWWPMKNKGCSIRMDEAGTLAQALAEVKELAACGQKDPVEASTEPSYRAEQGGRNRPPFDPQRLPKGDGAAERFDEFS